MNGRVPWIGKIAYGLGDFGFSLFFLTASLYLLFYYTDVLGLPPAIAGWVFGGALVWDAVFDPLMGGFANRVRTRWGRYRPFLLFGAVPAALGWILIFLPTPFTGGALVAFAVAAHVLFRTVYAVAYMPYLALSAAMTRDSRERSTLAACRMMGQAGAGLLAAFTTPRLVEALGGARAGYFHVAIVYGVVATVLVFGVFATAREIADEDPGRAPPGYAQMARMVARNRPFWLIAFALLTGYVAGVFFNKSIPYYVKYGLGAPGLIGPSLGILSGMITLSIPGWTFVTRRWSKRGAYLAGTVIALCAYGLLWFAPQRREVWFPLLALLGLGTGGIYLSTWAMLPDTVEFGEWRSGVRAEGAVFGFISLLQKTSLGVAAGLLGQVLAGIGYRADDVQSPETLASLRAVMIGVPALFAVLAGGFVYFYPLDARTHRRIVAVLDRRRQRVAPASEPVPAMRSKVA